MISADVDGNDIWVGTVKGLGWGIGDGYYPGTKPRPLYAYGQQAPDRPPITTAASTAPAPAKPSREREASSHEPSCAIRRRPRAASSCSALAAGIADERKPAAARRAGLHPLRRPEGRRADEEDRRGRRLRDAADEPEEGRELRRHLRGSRAVRRRQAVQGELPPADGVHGRRTRHAGTRAPRHGEDRLHRAHHADRVDRDRRQEPRGGARRADAAGRAARARGVERARRLPEAQDPVRTRRSATTTGCGARRATKSSSRPTRTRSGAFSEPSTARTATSPSGWR